VQCFHHGHSFILATVNVFYRNPDRDGSDPAGLVFMTPVFYDVTEVAPNGATSAVSSLAVMSPAWLRILIQWLHHTSYRDLIYWGVRRLDFLLRTA